MKIFAAALILILAALAPASRAKAFEGCNFENYAYFEGQTTCQFGNRMKCVESEWVQTGEECSESDKKEALGGVRNPANPAAVDLMDDEAESPPEVEMHQ